MGRSRGAWPNKQTALCHSTATQSTCCCKLHPDQEQRSTPGEAERHRYTQGEGDQVDQRERERDRETQRYIGGVEWWVERCPQLSRDRLNKFLPPSLPATRSPHRNTPRSPSTGPESSAGKGVSLSLVYLNRTAT